MHIASKSKWQSKAIMTRVVVTRTLVQPQLIEHLNLMIGMDDLPASSKITTEGEKATITKKTIRVRVSLSGNAESVYESIKSDIYNTTQ